MLDEWITEREVSSTTQIWPTVTRPWRLWSIHKASGKKSVRGQKRVGCVWLRATDLALFLAGSQCSRHWTGHRGKNNPCPPGLHQPEEEGDSSGNNTDSTCQEGHARRTPRDTHWAGQEHCCLSITRKTKPSSTGQPRLLYLSCTQRKWELDKENT